MRSTIWEQSCLRNQGDTMYAAIATMSASTATMTIQRPAVGRLSLHMWQGNQVTDQQSELAIAANSMLTRADVVAEFAALLLKAILRELLRLQKINHNINIIPVSSCIPTYWPSGDRLNPEITDKINRVDISGRVARVEQDTNAVVMFNQLPQDRPKEPRFLLHRRPWNGIAIRNQTPLPNTEQAREFVAVKPLWNKIDLTDVYHNIRIDPDSEQHNTFLCHIGHYRSRVVQQGDCNVHATVVRAVNEIFRDMNYKDWIIYIYDIIIWSRNYKQHVEALWKALQRLPDQQFWLKESKCQFFNKSLDILVHILTPEGLSADPLKVQTIFDLP